MPAGELKTKKRCRVETGGIFFISPAKKKEHFRQACRSYALCAIAGRRCLRRGATALRAASAPQVRQHGQRPCRWRPADRHLRTGRALPSPASGTQGRTNAVDRCAGNVWHLDAQRSCTGSFRHKRSILFSFSCARRAGVPFSCKKKEPKRTCAVPDRYKQKAAATFVATAIPNYSPALAAQAFLFLDKKKKPKRTCVRVFAYRSSLIIRSG